MFFVEEIKCSYCDNPAIYCGLHWSHVPSAFACEEHKGVAAGNVFTYNKQIVTIQEQRWLIRKQLNKSQ